jgi:integrase
MIDAGMCRGTINKHVGRIRRMFRWATAEEMLPASVHQALAALPGLQRGRTAAREPEPIQPVSDEVVEATLPFLPVVVADMVRFQRLTGCRPEEVCMIRPCDVDNALLKRPSEAVAAGEKALSLAREQNNAALAAQIEAMEPEIEQCAAARLSLVQHPRIAFIDVALDARLQRSAGARGRSTACRR